MSGVDGRQQRLDLKVVREPVPEVSPAVVQRQPDFRAALNLCLQASGLDYSQIAAECGIDAGQFSRIVKGNANFPDEKLNHLMDICGNQIPLEWLAFSCGYRLQRLQSEVEAELDRVSAERDELELKLRHFEEFTQIARGKA